MDGSLLHTDKTMPKGFFELIQKLKQQGILFAAGSGRQLASLQNSFQPVQKDMYFIAENGCITIDGSTQNVLDVHCLDKGYVKNLSRYVATFRIHMLLYVDANLLIMNLKMKRFYFST